MMSNNNNNTNDFILLRSLLQSDEDLQIRSAGDFDQICLKLDYNINITFFIDSSTESLTINTIHDLRISKVTNKDSLTNDQWIKTQNVFQKLIQQSDRNTSLYSIIQSIQEYLSKTNTKSHESQSFTSMPISRENASTHIDKFRGANLIFNRLAHDPTIDRSKVMIGYEDRFTGIHEIAFNEFKKVHEDESGIPMHRIRYYKIDEHIVWDRIKKIDNLTGSEIHNENTTVIDMEQSPVNLIEGMYEFDRLNHRWNLCPYVHLASDNLKDPSLDNMCIPERCQILTWNILFDYFHSELIYTNSRYPEILKTLKSFLPDIICLQEVTLNFLNLLLNEIWLQENNYYIIIMGSILNCDQKHTYGQVILTKNFRARAFTICPIQLFENSSNKKSKYTKEYIIARFGLNSKVTIDLVNLHLHSDCSYNAVDKRCQALEYLLKTMNTQNYMLIGDFNFGDNYSKEHYLLQKYQYQIHDLWKDIYDIEENPGYTFDPSRNSCAQITSKSQQSLRLDRYLLHTLHNLSYSIEHLNMVGLETIPIDSQTNKRINQSDHFGLLLIINFRIRSISDRSMLAILPPIKMDSVIETFREQNDPLVNQCSLHLNLFWPFFDLTNNEDDEENILLPLRLLLAQYQSFEIIIDGIDSSTENHTVFLKLDSQSTKSMENLYEQIQQLFSQCLSTNEKKFNPHIRIAQFDTNKRLNQIKSTITLTNPIRFPVRYISVLQKTDTSSSFYVTHQLPLGQTLEPIDSNQLYGIDSLLKECFYKMNLYNNEQSYERKHEKFHRLSICFQEIFNQNTLHCYVCLCLPYGSFRLGLNGEDLDIVFVLSEHKSINNPTNLDQTFLRFRYDPSELTNRVLDLLEKQIYHVFNNEILNCRRIQALYPILSIVFTDQTRVEIFVEIKEPPMLNESNLLLNFHEPIHGVHDIERLIIYVRHPPIFQYLLTFIRTWAQHVGFYGQVYGYLGGYSWAILCAYICHRYLPENQSIFSTKQLFDLIKQFFSFYSHFNWLHESLHLPIKLHFHDQSSMDNRGSMRILCPTPPFNNSARSTINSTRDLIIQGFQQANDILEKTNNNENNLKEILELPNQFPDKTIQSIIQLTLSGQTINELNQWLGYMKSRLAHFVTDCEDECHLFVQTDTKVEIRQNDLERFYSIGFQIDEQVLSRHRQFYYTFNKFLDEFKICSFRSETMKISFKLTSILDWNNERIKK